MSSRRLHQASLRSRRLAFETNAPRTVSFRIRDRTSSISHVQNIARDNQVAIAKAGGIPPLVALIRDGTNAQKERAAGALRNLSFNADSKVAIAKETRSRNVVLCVPLV